MVSGGGAESAEAGSSKLWLPLAAVAVVATVVAAVVIATSEGDRDVERVGATGEKDGTQHLRVCMPGAPRTLDPALVQRTADTAIVNELYDGLLVWSDGGEPIPGLARTFEVSEDGRTWTFSLRREARWSNGDPITTHDFVLHFARVLRSGGPRAGELVRIRGARAYAERDFQATTEPPELPDTVAVRAIDAHTLQVELEEPDRLAAYRFADPAFRPIPTSSVDAASDLSRATELVTSGPFRIARMSDDWIELSRSATYWDKAHSELSRVTFRFSSPEKALQLFEAGECDATSSNNLPPDYDGTGNPSFRQTPLAATYFLVANVERVSNRHLRRALSMSLDRRLFLGLVPGAHPTTSLVPGMPRRALSGDLGAKCVFDDDRANIGLPISDGMFCYVPPKGLAYDPVGAKRELDQARAELGNQFPSLLRLTFNESPSLHRRIAEIVSQAWRDQLGLDVVLEPLEWRPFLKDTVAGNFDVAPMGWIGSTPDPAEFLAPYRCRSPLNRARWCDRGFDEQLAANKGSVEENLARALKAESRLLEDAVIIPLYIYRQRALVRPEVEGLNMNLFARSSLRGVSIRRDGQ